MKAGEPYTYIARLVFSLPAPCIYIYHMHVSYKLERLYLGWSKAQTRLKAQYYVMASPSIIALIEFCLCNTHVIRKARLEQLNCIIACKSWISIVLGV